MGNREQVLATVVTAEQALAWVVETTIKTEVEYTEANNENRTLADYLSDIEAVLGRIIEGDGYDVLVPVKQTYTYEPDDEDPYTSEPTHLRIYREETGDEFPWCIDGADDEGRYTKDVRRFTTRDECVMYADLFVVDAAYDGVTWKWQTQRKPTTIRR